jgi:branched-chain amino acid transport system substrate-binding protein
MKKSPLLLKALGPLLAFTFLATAKAHCLEPLKVGVILPLSGAQAPFGKMEELGLLLAQEEINARRELAGEPPIEFLIRDDRSYPEGARSAFEKLLDVEGLLMVLGGYASNSAWAIAPIAEKSQLPLLLTYSRADKITEQGWKFVFRLCPPASAKLQALESFFQDAIRPSRAALLYEKSLFGLRSSRAAEEILKRKGHQVVFHRGFEPEAESFEDLLDEVEAESPEILYLASSTGKVSKLLEEAWQAGLRPRILMGQGRVFGLPELYNKAGSAAEGLLTTALWVPTLPYQGSEAFSEKFLSRYNKHPDHLAALAYAGAYVADDALRRASLPEPKAVRQALAETDLSTILGPVRFVSFGKKTNQNRSPVYVVRWTEGRWEIVWPARLATALIR